MLPDLGRGGVAAEASWERDFPEPCGRGVGVWFQADPLQPSPGGPGRPQTVGTDSTLLGPIHETFFSLHPFHASLILSQPFTWLPTHAFMQQRATINVLVGPCSRASESSPRAVRFCFTLLLRVALDSVGTLIPAAGWLSAYSCQRPSSWSDVCDFVYHNSGQPQFFSRLGAVVSACPVLFSAFRLWRLRPVSCSR